MRVQEVMTTGVVSIGPDETADAAWSLMEHKGIRHLVVTEGKRLLGVLSERDLGGRKGRVVRKGRAVRELMTPRVAVATPTTTLRQAANVMRGRLIGCLPVLDDGRIVGIATATDVLEELGRGSTRPTVRAKRKAVRLPPASVRAARREGARKRQPQAARRVRKGGKGSQDAGGGGGSEASPARAAVATPGGVVRGTRRPRAPDSVKRAPFPQRVARAEKRSAARTDVPATTAHIRSIGSVLDAEAKRYLLDKLGRKLGKFGSSIERTSVRVEDVNGPRGGVDKRCRIKVVLSGLPSVVVDERHQSLQNVLDGALARVERSVRKTVRRRTMKPLRQRDTGKRPSASG